MSKHNYPQTLASETWDNVIDHLHDDTYSLAACALVNRTWRSAAQYHQFRTVRIVLSHHTGKARVKDVFPKSGEGINRYARRLIVDNQGPIIYVGPLFAKLPEFPRLRKLMLKHATGALSTTWVHTQAKTLTHLYLALDIEDPHVVMRLLSACQSLVTLAVADNYELRVPEDPTTLFAKYKPPPMKNIDFSFWACEPSTDYDHPTAPIADVLSQWIAFHKADNPDTPENFRYMIVILDDIIRLQVILDSLSSHIKHLGLYPVDTECSFLSFEVAVGINLSDLNQLDSIHLAMSLRDEFHDIQRMLSTITSTRFSKIILELDLHYPRNGGWEADDQWWIESEGLGTLMAYLGTQLPVHPAQKASLNIILRKSDSTQLDKDIETFLLSLAGKLASDNRLQVQWYHSVYVEEQGFEHYWRRPDSWRQIRSTLE